MKNTKRTLSGFTSVVFMLALASPLLSFDEKAAGALTDIQVSFKLDPRLSGPTYGGERWISPPTYTGAADQDTVEVRAQGLDAKGNLIRISPEWTPADPEMVTVSPSQGDAVTITVKRAGESKLKVSSQGVSKELQINAKPAGNALQVEIVQLVEVKEPAAAAAAPDASPLKSQKEKLSYAFGMSFGSGLRKQPMEMDLDLVIQGLKDAVSGAKPLLTEEEARATLTVLQHQLMEREMASQGERNKKEGETFLAENKTKEGVVSLSSGLQYKILKVGDGKKPTIEDKVVCNYRGVFLDGKEFDSSYKRQRSMTFPVKGLTKGWSEALQLMPVGSKWQLFIPPNLAYGERGAPKGGIGPNATLLFEVELLSIEGKTPAGAAKPQTATLKN